MGPQADRAIRGREGSRVVSVDRLWGPQPALPRGVGLPELVEWGRMGRCPRWEAQETGSALGPCEGSPGEPRVKPSLGRWPAELESTTPHGRPFWTAGEGSPHLRLLGREGQVLCLRVRPGSLGVTATTCEGI